MTDDVRPRFVVLLHFTSGFPVQLLCLSVAQTCNTFYGLLYQSLAIDFSDKMPGLIRRLSVCASINGLVVQGHGPNDYHKAIQIDYKTHRVTACPDDDVSRSKKEVQLEAHGLIGSLLSVRVDKACNP